MSVIFLLTALVALCIDFFPEEILDDGVGLISETSGDSLDDDTELFIEYRDYEKVKISECLLRCFTAPLSRLHGGSVGIIAVSQLQGPKFFFFFFLKIFFNCKRYGTNIVPRQQYDRDHFLTLKKNTKKKKKNHKQTSTPSHPTTRTPHLGSLLLEQSTMYAVNRDWLVIIRSDRYTFTLAFPQLVHLFEECYKSLPFMKNKKNSIELLTATIQSCECVKPNSRV